MRARRRLGLRRVVGWRLARLAAGGALLVSTLQLLLQEAQAASHGRVVALRQASLGAHEVRDVARVARDGRQRGRDVAICKQSTPYALLTTCVPAARAYLHSTQQQRRIRYA